MFACVRLESHGAKADDVSDEGQLVVGKSIFDSRIRQYQWRLKVKPIMNKAAKIYEFLRNNIYKDKNEI